MDRAEWTGTVTEAGPLLFRIARQIVGDESSAEDVVAKTYLRAWQKRDQLRERSKLLPWLKRICRNCALDLARRRSSDPLSPHAELIEGTHAAQPPPRQPGHPKLLEKLPDSLKSIARMRFVDRMGYSEIAEIESLPTSTVRGRVHMAKERIRKEIVMSTENAEPRLDRWDDGELKPAPDNVVVWRDMKLRLLGTWRPGQKGFYSPDGKRLSRVPAAVRKSGSFQNWDEHWVDPAEHVLVWFKRTGTPGYTFVSRCPSRSERHNRIMCSRLPDEKAIDGRRSLVSVIIGPVVEEDEAAVRFETDFNQPCSVLADPSWGAAFISHPRTAEDDACGLAVAYLSPVAKRDWAVRGLTEDNREVDPSSMAQACVQMGQGGLTGLELEFPVPAEELSGAVFRPRWHVRVDWGTICMPPAAPGGDA